MRNEMEIIFDAYSDNEGFARVAVAAFVAKLNPTVEELSDIKTAVSEAVTNCIIHGYDSVEKRIEEEKTKMAQEKQRMAEKIYLRCRLEGAVLHIEIKDTGRGIEDVKRAMEPLYTTKPELERSGMGFAFMEAFMDDLEVESAPGLGTTVRMIKKIGLGSWLDGED